MKTFPWLLACVLVIIAVFGCKNRSSKKRPKWPWSPFSSFRYKPLLDQEDAPTDNEKIPQKKIHKCDFLIIGGGAQMTAVAGRILENRPYELTATVVEKKPKLGHGEPYDEDVVTVEHLVHTLPAGIAPLPKPGDFMTWFRGHRDYVRDPKEHVMSPPKRKTVGKYLGQRFQQYAEKCKIKKRFVHSINGTSAVNMFRMESGFIVELSNGDTVHTRDVLLATGYFDKTRFEKPVDGYFDSPWPARNLIKRIIKAAHVGILGSGLNAIDAVFTVAGIFGKFENIPGLGVTYNTTFKDFEMTMYSRSGHLPGVNGKLDTAIDTHVTNFINLVAKNAVQQFKDANEDFLPLDGFVALVKHVATEVDPALAESNGFAETGPADFFAHIDTYLYGDKTPKERLKTDIDRARDNVQRREPMALQDYFFYARKLFNLYVRDFSAEDTILYKKRMASGMSKISVPMPLCNAEKLLALMEAGRLHLKAVGPDSEIVRNRFRAGVRIKFGDQDVPHRYFIDATGQSGDLDEAPKDHLTKRLLANGLVQKLRIPFRNQTTGRKAFQEQTAFNEAQGRNGKKRNRIFEEKGKYFYYGDGAEVDMKTMRIIPVGQSAESVARDYIDGGVIYGTGPFVYGRYPNAQGLPDVVSFADRAVSDLEDRISKRMLKAYQTQPVV